LACARGLTRAPPQLLSVRGVHAHSADRNELLALLSNAIREARFATTQP
jgi:hypothetical protein